MILTRKSESDPKVTYYVTKNADGAPQCSCPGYRFQRTCKHVKAVQSEADK